MKLKNRGFLTDITFPLSWEEMFCTKTVLIIIKKIHNMLLKDKKVNNQ